MKFFIPLARSESDAEQVYESVRKFVGEQLDATFSDRRVRVLRWRHDTTDYEAEVGQDTRFNNEIVIAILYEPMRDLYHVCTPTRGVVRGMSILAGARSVSFVEDFDPE